jgi:hypothetical protein
MQMSHFISNNMAHHHDTTESSDSTSMKLYQTNGCEEKELLNMAHAHLI